MKRWHKALILSLMGGDLYCMVELIWRGHTHWSMFLLAAMLSLPLDLANEHMAWERPLWLQALIGGSVITLAELGLSLIHISCGKQTKAESLGYTEMAIARVCNFV